MKTAPTPAPPRWAANNVRNAARASQAPAPSRLPFLLFCVYVLVLVGRPQDVLPAFAPLRLVLVFTGLTVLVTFFRKERSETKTFQSLETKLFLVFYAGMFIGIPFAVHRRVAFDYVVQEYTASIIMHLLFVTHVNTPEKFKRLIHVLALSSLVFTAVGLSQGTYIGGRYYIGSPMYDTNDVAFVELALLPFPLALLMGSSKYTTKLWAGLAIIFGVLLLLFTGSRGGLLGLATFFLLFMMLKIPKIGKAAKLAIAVVLTVAAITNIDKINVERYQTLGEIENDYNWEEFGRMEIWERGVQLFLASPIVGVGVNCFPIAIAALREAEIGIPRWQPSHSSYIQVLTETGLLGTVPFIFLIVASLLNFNRVRRARAMPDKEISRVSGLLIIGFVAQLVAASFLTLAFSVFFTMTFAMSASLRQIAAKQAREEVSVAR